ncbi:MAG TPA: GAF domain-containing sensor histidine kinase [Acidimicrobiales bacterium]|nr:GAF domain-containing sensor histidine kinase [Acidimicrobiales bacterium]
MAFEALHDPARLRALLASVLAVESDLELPGVLQRVVDAARELTGARYGALGVLDPQGKGLAEFVYTGVDEEVAQAVGHLPEGAGILGLLIVDPRPLRLADLTKHPDSVGFPPGHPPMRSFLGVPIRVRDEVFGNLYLTEKVGAPEFSEEDEALAVALAGAAGLAVGNARLYARVRELSVAADRERIARDLHDRVIQQLFATGLALQSVLPVTEVPEVRERIQEAVAELDDTIRQIRTTIFALEPPPAAAKGVRAQVLEVCAEATRSLGFEPEVRFVGTVDRSVDGAVAPELLSTLREALSNVARHARARHVEVTLSAIDGGVELTVADDGVGIPTARAPGGRGLANMAERAAALGGDLALASRPGGGTALSWRVPVRG